MTNHPEPVVGAFIRNSKREVLLVRSYKWKNDLWVVPGGHIEYGESMEHALKREVLEETGVEVDGFRLITVYDGLFPPEFHEKRHFLFFQCECTLKKGQTVSLDNKELKEYKWFSLPEAIGAADFPLTKKTLKLLLEADNHYVRQNAGNS